MSDVLQSALHSLAVQHPRLGQMAVFMGDKLWLVLVVAWVVLLLAYRRRLTWEFSARALIALVITGVLALLLSHLIPDPRPYIAEHYIPLSHVSSDNGFPSDHTLLAAFLSALLLWINWRWASVFAFFTVLVAMGRLAIGAHHTLDVVGSLLIVGVAVGLASWIRLPTAWKQKPIFAAPQP